MNAGAHHSPEGAVSMPACMQASDGMQRQVLKDRMLPMYKRMSTAIIFAALTVVYAGCSESSMHPDVTDAAVDASTPGADCEQMQREYVNRTLVPGQETDVVQAVTSVLGASDFPHAMPYCSGPRPGNN
jgi:hypothetical protein